jgi:hypothetical protein
MSAYRKFVDTLQSEPRILTPPKPPKAPKANPSEPVSLPVLGGLGTLGAPPMKSRFMPPRVRLCQFQRGPFGTISRMRALPMASMAATCRMPARRSSPQANGWNASHYRRRASRDFLSRGCRDADGWSRRGTRCCISVVSAAPGQLRLRRRFARRENGAVVLRRSPRSRQDSAVSLYGEPRHPTVLFCNVAEACCSIGNLAND